MNKNESGATYRFVDRSWKKVDLGIQLRLVDERRQSILLVHGQPGCGTKWGPLPLRLSSRFDVFSYDRPGWGESVGRARDVIENAELLNSIVAKMTISLGQVPIVLAYSYGATIAIRALATEPSRFTEVLLIAPAMSPLAINRYDKVLALPIIGVATAFFTSLFSLKYIGTGVKEIFKSTKSLRIEAKNLLTELVNMPKCDLSSLKLAILAGTSDFVTPPGSIYDGAKKYSISSIEWLNGASHLLPWRNSDAILLFAERSLKL